LVLLLILSGLAWYFYADFGKGKLMAIVPTEKTELTEQAEPIEQPKTTNTVVAELPPAPQEIEGYEELLPSAAQTPNESSIDSFDIQAHLQLMRQNVAKYNYTLAYRHGARIGSSLLADPKLTAEWGNILLEAGKLQEAVDVLKRITSEDTVKSEVAMDMALAMFRSGNADGAIEFLDAKMQSNSDVDLLATKAAIIGEHPDVKRRAAAEQLFLRCVKNNNVSPITSYWYGRFLMQKGDYQNSKMYLERALRAKPNEPRYIARLGMAEFHLKQDSKAEALYKQALRINPYDYNTWFNLGELYLSLANESSDIPNVRQKTQQAMSSYLKTIENDSLHAMANYRIGLILNWNGQHKESIGHLTIALGKTPNNIPIMQQLSSAYIKLGDTTKSVGYLETILKIDPFNKIAADEFNRIRGRR